MGKRLGYVNIPLAGDIIIADYKIKFQNTIAIDVKIDFSSVFVAFTYIFNSPTYLFISFNVHDLFISCEISSVI